jgi:hypothetical protein
MKGMVLIMTKKMTRKEMFAEIKAVVETSNLTAERMAEMTAFIEKQIEQLERKSGTSKPTKTQLENESIKAEILEIFSTMEKPVTVTEFCELTTSEIGNLSNQKLSALFNQLVKAEKLTKSVEKKKSYFALA